MDADDVRRLLREACRGSGGEARFAQRCGCARQLVYAVLNGDRAPRGKILDALELRMVVSYEPVTEAKR